MSLGYICISSSCVRPFSPFTERGILLLSVLVAPYRTFSLASSCLLLGGPINESLPPSFRDNESPFISIAIWLDSDSVLNIGTWFSPSSFVISASVFWSVQSMRNRVTRGLVARMFRCS